MDFYDNSDDSSSELIFLLDDNVFQRWRVDYDYFSRHIYNRVFALDNLRFRGYRAKQLPEIKHRPNTDKLMKSSFYQDVRLASSNQNSSIPHKTRPPLIQMLNRRERNGKWLDNQRCFVNNMFVPNQKYKTVMRGDKSIFCSAFSTNNDGRYLLVAGMDGNVTVYDAKNSRYTEIHKYFLDQFNYSILDIDISPSGTEFLCSTWSNSVFTCDVLEDENNCNYFKYHKLVNTTERIAIFSTTYNNDGTELLGSCNDGGAYLYDRSSEKRTAIIRPEGNDDLNAVRFLDRTNNNLILGGFNDGMVELWDRRAYNHRPVGTLIGHYDGITYIHSKDDGRYFITNSKDQSIKLWDIRKCQKRDKKVQKARRMLSNHTWNYLIDNIPPEYYGDMKMMAGDCSLMTYRGHRVWKTLIRAKFSPLETTGNRYIYTGCSTGHLVVYDTLTGKMVNKVESHADLVRDVAWHPKRAEIITAAFDGSVNLNVYGKKEVVEKRLRRSVRIADRNSKRVRRND